MPRFTLRAADGQQYRLDTHDLKLLPLWLADMLPDATGPSPAWPPAELEVCSWARRDAPQQTDWPPAERPYVLDNAGRLRLLNAMRDAIGLTDG